MNEVNTNFYVVDELTENYTNEKIEEIKKIVSVNKNNKKLSREFVIKNQNYTTDEKIIYLEILDKLDNINTSGKFKTTNFDGKIYSMLFIKEFGQFMRNPVNNFTAREMKLLLAIYEIIVDANAFGNCLISCNKSYLAESAGIDKANLSVVLKSLQKKEIIKIDKHGSIFLNYKYFFMGNSLNYDMYKVQYENLQ